jgi:hypothetical protein
MVLQRSTVNSNRTFDIGGGGIRNDGTMTIDHSTVNSNPGGIYNSAQLLMSYTTVSRNGSCPEPGGLWNGGTATVRFSTFALNSSCNSSGGGISNGGSITIVGSTIVDNTADEGGGGLLNGGTATIAATIIAGNEDTSGDSSDCVGTIVSQGYNLIGFDVDMATGSACVVTGGPNDQIGSSSPIDAMLKPLGNYGGPTQTILPRPGSPAVNAVPTGTTTTVGTALCPASGTTDQRGIQRPQSAACDIGSVERKPKE